MLYIYSVY